METARSCEKELNLKETELRLGLPGRCDDFGKDRRAGARINKRAAPPEAGDEESRSSKASSSTSEVDNGGGDDAPSSKARIVGWPPVRSRWKNSLQSKKNEVGNGTYVKVSMDGAPYLRKVDLKGYKGYPELLKALEDMFKIAIGEYSEREGYNGSEFAPTYEDKDGDWMLVGDVPWEMFTSSCKKLRIMKGSEAQGMGYL